jgi:NitT/TauT family transport system substrate-binding protein
MLTRAITRRRFLVVGSASAAAVAALEVAPLLRTLSPERRRLGWASPRGALSVVDDYPLWAAAELGYFRKQGLDVKITPGTQHSDSALGQVLDHSSDIAFPSPNLLTTSIDRGLDLRSFFQLSAGPHFGFALSPGTQVRTPNELTGATIAVGSESWRDLVEPLLVEAGVDPRSVRLVVSGDAWLKVAADGKTDAALVWNGLQGAADSRGLRFLLGDHWSKLPANSYVARGSDLADNRARDVLVAFTRAVVMGLEFAHLNPTAAAKITHQRAPGLSAVMSQAEAVRALRTVASTYDAGRRSGQPWGIHQSDRWSLFLRIQEELGRVKQLQGGDVYTNELVGPANNFDIASVRNDALTFGLSTAGRLGAAGASNGN